MEKVLLDRPRNFEDYDNDQGLFSENDPIPYKQFFTKNYSIYSFLFRLRDKQSEKTACQNLFRSRYIYFDFLMILLALLLSYFLIVFFIF